MSRPRKLTCPDADLRERRARGDTLAQIAAHHGVSITTVCQRLQQIDAAAAPAPDPPPGPAPPEVPAAGGCEGMVLDVVAALRSSVAELQALRADCRRQSGQPENRRLLLAVLHELRGHLELAVRLSERWYSVTEMQRFQQEVLDVIRQADPETAERFRAAFRERQILGERGEPRPEITAWEQAGPREPALPLGSDHPGRGDEK